MMKYLFIVLLALSNCSFDTESDSTTTTLPMTGKVDSGKINSYLYNSNLNGQVQAVIEFTSKVKQVVDQDNVSPPHIIRVQSIDTFGFKFYDKIWNSRNHVISLDTMSFWDNGQFKQRTKKVGVFKPIIENIEIEGRYVEHYSDYRLFTQSIVDFDSLGVIKSESIFSQNGTILELNRFEVDNNGHIVMEISRRPGESGAVTTTYEYDEYGYAILGEDDSELLNQEKEFKVERLYNEKGFPRLISYTDGWLIRFKNKIPKIEKIIFDKKGKPIQRIKNSDGDGNMMIIEKLNSHRDVISEDVRFSNNVEGYTTTYEYVYDSMGNWIEKTAFDNGVAKEYVTKRTIKYYE